MDTFEIERHCRFAQWLRQERSLAGLTQEELALEADIARKTMLDFEGIPVKELYPGVKVADPDAFCARRIPKRSTLLRLTQALGTDVSVAFKMAGYGYEDISSSGVDPKLLQLHTQLSMLNSNTLEILLHIVGALRVWQTITPQPASAQRKGGSVNKSGKPLDFGEEGLPDGISPEEFLEQITVHTQQGLSPEKRKRARQLVSELLPLVGRKPQESTGASHAEGKGKRKSNITTN